MSVFPLNIAHAILNIDLHYPPALDSVVWLFSKDDMFSVKSGWHWFKILLLL
ncbi:hypothetical protein LguiA_028609 [Lonicera macranthoides]